MLQPFKAVSRCLMDIVLTVASRCGAARVAGCLYAYVNDGDLRRGFPDYWEPFERYVELLDSDSWEVCHPVSGPKHVACACIRCAF